MDNTTFYIACWLGGAVIAGIITHWIIASASRSREVVNKLIDIDIKMAELVKLQKEANAKL